MSGRTLQRVAFVLCVLVGVALLTVRKDIAAGESPGPSGRPPLVQAAPAGAPLSSGASPAAIFVGPHYFSSAYEYCYVDTEGRPMFVHKRKLAFFMPAPPPEVHEHTFVELDECR